MIHIHYTYTDYNYIEHVNGNGPLTYPGKLSPLDVHPTVDGPRFRGYGDDVEHVNCDRFEVHGFVVGAL